MHKFLRAVPLMIALAASITACSPGVGAEPTDETPTEEPTTENEATPPDSGTDAPADADDPLAGTAWNVVRINQDTLLPETAITMTFEAGQITGSAGCNTYSAGYRITPLNEVYADIAIDSVTITEEGCGDLPPGAMEQEALFVQVLGSVTGVNLNAVELQMVSADGMSFLILRSADDPTVSITELAGTEWSLTSLNGESPLEGSQVTLEFEMDRLGGYGGCNSYGGSHVLGENGQITIPEIAHTDMLCMEPEGVSDQETAYLELLRQMTRYEVIDASTLELHAEDGSTLVFNAMPQYDMNPADLVGTAWQLVRINGEALPDGIEPPTIHFVEEGKLTGYAGCRDFESTYLAEGDDLAFTSTSMLSEVCEGEAAQQFEGNFTTLLGRASRYRIEGDTLELFSINGAVLGFERIP